MDSIVRNKKGERRKEREREKDTRRKRPAAGGVLPRTSVDIRYSMIRRRERCCCSCTRRRDRRRKRRKGENSRDVGGGTMIGGC
jgi:hypothetical protein